MASETNDDTASTPEERLERAEAALQDALRERNALWAQLQTRTAEERHVEHLQRVIAAMEGSLSWRITAPLRVLKRLLGSPGATLRAVRSRLGR
jgi:hypothetical protein